MLARPAAISRGWISPDNQSIVWDRGAEDEHSPAKTIVSTGPELESLLWGYRRGGVPRPMRPAAPPMEPGANDALKRLRFAIALRVP